MLISEMTSAAEGTWNYQTGVFLGQLALLALGCCLIASGRSDRRTYEKGDGVAKMAIGGLLLASVAALLLAGPQ